jgi:hypothetical protein
MVFIIHPQQLKLLRRVRKLKKLIKEKFTYLIFEY